MRSRPIEERFWEKVEKTDTCWLWTAYVRPNGYGSIQGRRGPLLVHRLAFEWAFGPIRPGLTIDHLCRTRHCVRPAHMEAVANRTNVLRGVGPTAVNAQKTHCPQGHPYSPENTMRRRVRGVDGGRLCRECYRQSWRRWYAAKKAAA